MKNQRENWNAVNTFGKGGRFGFIELLCSRPKKRGGGKNYNNNKEWNFFLFISSHLMALAPTAAHVRVLKKIEPNIFIWKLIWTNFVVVLVVSCKCFFYQSYVQTKFSEYFKVKLKLKFSRLNFNSNLASSRSFKPISINSSPAERYLNPSRNIQNLHFFNIDGLLWNSKEVG